MIANSMKQSSESYQFDQLIKQLILNENFKLRLTLKWPFQTTSDRLAQAIFQVFLRLHNEVFPPLFMPHYTV